MIGGVDTYMSQNVPAHITGADASGTVNQSITTSTTAYADVKDTMTQSITVASLDLNAGDVFTIAGVYAVNPVTKATLPFLRQFVVTADADGRIVWLRDFIRVIVGDQDRKRIHAVNHLRTLRLRCGFSR